MTAQGNHNDHYDPLASKIGMWIFIFTELLLFGGLFIVYSVLRFTNQEAFHLAARELDTVIGTVNTIILLISSMTIAMSVSSIQSGNKKLTLFLIATTIVLGLAFLVNKYFEWSLKIEHGLYPGSSILQGFGNGDTLFFGLYFFMTGLHALHIVVGLVILIVLVQRVSAGRINSGRHVLLENGALYWHLVDVIWIFLFPLFYLIS
jgi:cytochrome c oxidase subunit 3